MLWIQGPDGDLQGATLSGREGGRAVTGSLENGWSYLTLVVVRWNLAKSRREPHWTGCKKHGDRGLMALSCRADVRGEVVVQQLLCNWISRKRKREKRERVQGKKNS